MRSIYCTMNPDLGCKRMHIHRRVCLRLSAGKADDHGAYVVEGRNLPWGPEFDLNDENGEQWSFSE